MPASGIDYLSPVRSFRNFFGTYGTTGGSIRGLLNAIVPVAIVDRYRDDNEGSIFSLTATCRCAANNHAAFSVGSIPDDWELFGFNWGMFFPVQVPNNSVFMGVTWTVYTPDATFNPVPVFSPVGLWYPGLQPDFAFTLGSVTAVSGYNPNLPPRLGTIPFDTRVFSSGTTPLLNVDMNQREVTFDPPIRVYRDVSLGFTVIETFNRDVDFTISIRYRIRPRTTDGPRTGL